MDHLPKLGHAIGPYPRVPLLCKEKYDNLPFDGCQDRRGFSVQRLYNRDFSEHPPAETASFLQTWLYFGALNEVFGLEQPLNSDDFVEADSLGLRICTKHLNTYLTTWAKQMESLVARSMEECRAALDRVGVCLNTIQKIQAGLNICQNSPVPWEVTLSFGVLGCTIDHALQWFWGLGRGRDWGLANAAAARLLHSGWCPRDIAVAREFLSELPMYCTSFMARPLGSQGHWQCLQDTCKVNQIDERAYVTKHRMPGCQCAHISPIQSKIYRILDNGGVPVICLTPRRQPNGTRIFEVTVKDGGPWVHWYIAVSHVWSDGLGNPHCNSLPLCQLEFLYDLLVDTTWNEVYKSLDTMGDDKIEYNNEAEKKAIEGVAWLLKTLSPGVKRLVTPVREVRDKPLSIWIDTFCVPLERRYRKLAIAAMQDVYAKAVFTVVLDSELQCIESRRCSPEELLVRIGLAGWTRRAWTFQEGVLANLKLRFVFADATSPLPIWQRETDINCEIDFVNPKYTEAVRRINASVVRWGARHGVVASNPVPMSRLQEEAARRQSFTLPEFMLEEVKGFFMGMKTLWKSVHQYEQPSDLVLRMISAWESLRLRATSHEDDRFICFAAACAIGYKERERIQDLLTYPPEQRMKAWIQTQSAVPAGLLFVLGARYDDKGFRWVPKGVWRQPLVDKDLALRDQGSNELVFKKPGFMVFSPQYIADGFLISDQVSSLRYSVTPKMLNFSINTTLHSYGHLGIVIMQMVGQRQPEYEEYKETGALLGNVHTINAKVYGEFICLVEVQLFTAGEQSREIPMILARSLDGQQAWVIN